MDTQMGSLDQHVFFNPLCSSQSKFILKANHTDSLVLCVHVQTDSSEMSFYPMAAVSESDYKYPIHDGDRAHKPPDLLSVARYNGTGSNCESMKRAESSFLDTWQEAGVLSCTFVHVCVVCLCACD